MLKGVRDGVVGRKVGVEEGVSAVRNMPLPRQHDYVPEGIYPFIRLCLRVSHQPINHITTKDLKHLLFVCHSPHRMDMDEALGGLPLLCRLLLLVVLQYMVRSQNVPLLTFLELEWDMRHTNR